MLPVLSRSLAVLGLVAINLSVAQAAPITSLFGTGLDATGALLAAGAVDPHYSVTPGAGPFVVGNPTGLGWIANTSTSQWISAAADSRAGGGPFVYSTIFDLTGLDPSTALIDAEISSDNMATIRLNGSVVGTQPFGGWTNRFALTIGSGFLAGLNTLSFEIPNNQVSANDGPTGLQVRVLSATAAASSPVPEPSTLALTGLVLALALRRRSV